MAPPLGTPKKGGRKKGVPNRLTTARIQAIAASGLTPVDYLLSIVRDETAEREVRMDAAKAVAPYTNPRLNSVEHKGEIGSVYPIVLATVERRRAALALLLAREDEV